MYRLVNRLLQAGVIIAWIVLVVMLWRPARGMALTLLGAGVLMAALSLLILRRGRRRGAAGEPITDERAARMLVTQLLRDLTRIQVSYLNQAFADASEGRRWLKRRLPRSYRPSLEQLHGDLEAARGGNFPPALRLTERVVELQQELRPLEEALDHAAERHPEHALARPVVFVITDAIDSSDDRSEPLVVAAAGWNPQQRTLLAPVDVLTLFSEGPMHSKQVRGQAAFDRVTEALGERLRRLDSVGGTTLFSAEPLGDDQLPAELQLAPVPLGFIVGTGETL